MAFTQKFSSPMKKKQRVQEPEDFQENLIQEHSTPIKKNNSKFNQQNQKEQSDESVQDVFSESELTNLDLEGDNNTSLIFDSQKSQDVRDLDKIKVMYQSMVTYMGEIKKIITNKKKRKNDEQPIPPSPRLSKRQNREVNVDDHRCGRTNLSHYLTQKCSIPLKRIDTEVYPLEKTDSGSTDPLSYQDDSVIDPDFTPSLRPTVRRKILSKDNIKKPSSSRNTRSKANVKITEDNNEIDSNQVESAQLESASKDNTHEIDSHQVESAQLESASNNNTHEIDSHQVESAQLESASKDNTHEIDSIQVESAQLESASNNNTHEIDSHQVESAQLESESKDNTHEIDSIQVESAQLESASNNNTHEIDSHQVESAQLESESKDNTHEIDSHQVESTQMESASKDNTHEIDSPLVEVPQTQLLTNKDYLRALKDLRDDYLSPNTSFEMLQAKARKYYALLPNLGQPELISYDDSKVRKETAS